MVAVAVPPAIIAAIFALLFMLAWAQWGHSITGTLNVDLPIIGNVVGRYVGYALEASYQVMVGWFDSAIGPITDLILRPLIAVEATINGLSAAAENTYNAIWSVVTRTIPAAVTAGATTAIIVAQGLYNQAVAHADTLYGSAVAQIGTAISYSQQLYNQSVAYTVGAISGVRAYVDASIGAAVGYSQQLYNQSVALINNGVAQAEAYTLTAYHAATGYAATLALKAEQDLAATATTLETYAQTTATVAVGALATDLDHAITGALSGIYTDVDAAVHEAIGVITTGDEDILSALKAWPASVPLDLAGLAALTGVTSLTLARYLRDCGIPNCQNLSQLGRDLQAAITLIDDAAFLALLFELIHNPQGAAREVESAVGDLISEGLSLGRMALSI